MSKTRLAQKIKHSTPRLKLLSAVLLVNVMEHVRLTYSDIPDENVYYFSDSADVIFWLYSGHYSWRPFVANQIKKIKKKSARTLNWIHIDTTENTADYPSRGLSLGEMLEDEYIRRTWMHGPDFWKKGMYAGKSKLSGYDKHYRDLVISGTNCQS